MKGAPFKPWSNGFNLQGILSVHFSPPVSQVLAADGSIFASSDLGERWNPERGEEKSPRLAIRSLTMETQTLIPLSIR
jgi:hypothetical protein